VPYYQYTKTVQDNSTVTWTKGAKEFPSFEFLEQLVELPLEDAKQLNTEDKQLWLWIKIDRDKKAAGRGNSICSAEPIPLLIDRKHFLRDSFEQFRTTVDLDLRKDIRICFLNEVSQDAGGLIREWISILMEKLFNPKLGLFVKADTEEIAYLINERCNKLEYYYFCGKIIAKAFYERIPIKAYFSKIIWKQILGLKLELDDLKYCDKELYSSMKFIVDNPIPEGVDLGSFVTSKKDTIKKTSYVIELKEDGANIPITEDNKDEFASLLFEKSFIEPTSQQTEKLVLGFTSLISRPFITVLDPDELEYFLCGETTIDIKDWKTNTCYSSPYDSNHPLIQNFWLMVSKMSQRELENFLQFCTGCRRVPAGGFKGLNEGANKITPFKITPGSSNVGYILAHTCFNTIELPMYKDIDTMKKYVYEIINSPKSFQFTSE